MLNEDHAAKEVGYLRVFSTKKINERVRKRISGDAR